MKTPEEMAEIRAKLYGDQRVGRINCRHCGTPCSGTKPGGELCERYEHIDIQPRETDRIEEACKEERRAFAEAYRKQRYGIKTQALSEDGREEERLA